MIVVRRRRWLALFLTCAVASACATAPAPVARLEGPEASARVRSFEGTPLSGPAPVPSSVAASATPSDTWRVQVEWFVLREVPELGLDPLTLWARLVVANPDVEPRFSPAVLGRGAVLGRVPDGETFARALRERPGALRIAFQQGALPPGVTSAFELVEAGLPMEGDPLPTRVALLLYRPAPEGPPLVTRVVPAEDELTVAASAPRAPATSSRAALGGVGGVGGVGVGDQGTRTTSNPRDETNPGLRAPASIALDLEGHGLSGRDPCGLGPMRREVILVDEVLPPCAEGLVVALPSPFVHRGAAGPLWLLAVAQLAPAPEPGEVSYAAHIEAFAATSSEVERSRALVLPPPDELRPHPGAATLPNLEAVRQALLDPSEQRRALLDLADAVTAELTRDLALMGERRDVDRLSRTLSRSLAEPDAPVEHAGLRWLLDRLTIEVLRDRIVARELTPGLTTVLWRFAGAVADRPALLALVDAARGAADLEELLARENASLLDDPAPSVRAIAVRWLDARRPGLVPEDYDPLDAPRERRAALAPLRRQLDAAEPTAGGAAEGAAEPGTSSSPEAPQ